MRLPRPLTLPAIALGLAALLALGGCASWGQPLARPGEAQAAVLQRLGPPTGRYALEGGGTRLEYATGPYGRTTWMIDVGADGRVLAAEQVLTLQRFAQVREGMRPDEVLRLVGRPGEVAREYMDRKTWSWRYETNDCLWVRVTFTADGVVWGGASTLIDPHCDINLL